MMHAISPMFTRRRIIILLAATVLLLGAILYAVLRPARTLEPSYGGKTLSEWVVSLPPGGHITETHAVAIRAMGANVAPYLLQWIQYDQPTWQAKMDKFTSGSKILGFKLFDRQHNLANRRANKAMLAFEILGSEANAAIPELTRMMNANTNYGSISHQRPIIALGKIGTAALPPLLTMVTNQHAITRSGSIYAINKMGTNALPIVPIIVQWLTNENNGVVLNAIEALGRLHLQADRVVPVLTNFLVHSRLDVRCSTTTALMNFGHFGPEARSAIPLLQRLLTDSDLRMRACAANALREIDPQNLSNAPVR